MSDEHGDMHVHFDDAKVEAFFRTEARRRGIPKSVLARLVLTAHAEERIRDAESLLRAIRDCEGVTRSRA